MALGGSLGELPLGTPHAPDNGRESNNQSNQVMQDGSHGHSCATNQGEHNLGHSSRAVVRDRAQSLPHDRRRSWSVDPVSHQQGRASTSSRPTATVHGGSDVSPFDWEDFKRTSDRRFQTITSTLKDIQSWMTKHSNKNVSQCSALNGITHNSLH